MRVLALVGMLCAVASVGTAQRVPTAADTNSAARVKVARDSITCPVSPASTASRCSRARVRLDSIRAALTCPRPLSPSIPAGNWFCAGAPPPPPVNQKPVARFTVTVAPPACTYDASTSTDDRGIVSYAWRSTDPNRPPQTGRNMVRECTAGDPAFTEWLVVTDSAGLKDSTSRTVTPPAPPGPGPITSIDMSWLWTTQTFFASRATDTLGVPSIAWSPYAQVQPAPFDTVTVCAVVSFPDGRRKVGWPPVRVAIRNMGDRDSVYAMGNRSGNPLSSMCGNAVAADGVVLADSVPVSWTLNWLTYNGRRAFHPVANHSPP